MNLDPSLETQSPDSTENGNKRKSEDQAGSQRSKRNRYISIACNECKRRKIKCNGNTPCQRCGNLNLECVYAPNCCASNFRDSDEYKQMASQIASLQEQCDHLFASLSSLRSDFASGNPVIDPSLQPPFIPQRPTLPLPDGSPSASMLSPSRARAKSQSHPKVPSFRGPTSNDFSFDVAKSSLQTMGITPAPNGQGQIQDGGGPTLVDTTPFDSPTHPVTRMHPSKDPIWIIQREEALRLLGVYEDNMHEMYPVVSIARLKEHVDFLYKFMEAATRSGLMRMDAEGMDGINDNETNILKLILAISLHVEGQGRSELGLRLFEHVQPAVDALLLGEAGIKDVRILVLTAMYQFHADDEGTSWRVTGLAARLCIELGLHRREMYEMMTDDERDATTLLFWSIYCLDRRWSFGTGMPFALQDSDIDTHLPRPDGKSPYLTAMIDFCSIGSKVWQTVGSEHASSAASGSLKKEDLGWLDYQVLQWHQALPEQLRWHPSQMTLIDDPSDRLTSNYRLRVIVYLRANNMRINIYRPVLHSATSIFNNRQQAYTVVDVAKDTIRLLTHLAQTSTVYTASQSLFNPFLTSALAVLFLAVSHGPALFAERVREEFYMALDLVRGLSKGSFVSKRLWKTIRVLKEVGPQLGLSTKRKQSQRGQPGIEDSSRSAAVAMAGLAGHHVDELSLFDRSSNLTRLEQQQWASASLASSSPDNMANDLTKLFEAAGDGNGHGARLGLGTNGFGTGMSPSDASALGMSGFGNEEELNRIMRDLF